jgi:cell division protein FtsB
MTMTTEARATDIDLTPEAVERMCARMDRITKHEYACRDQLLLDCGLGQITLGDVADLSATIRALSARLAEVEAERDALKTTVQGLRAATTRIIVSEGNVQSELLDRAEAAEARLAALDTEAIAALVEALRAIAETSNYTRASWMQDTARAALARVKGQTK